MTTGVSGRLAAVLLFSLFLRQSSLQAHSRLLGRTAQSTRLGIATAMARTLSECQHEGSRGTCESTLALAIQTTTPARGPAAPASASIRPPPTPGVVAAASATSPSGPQDQGACHRASPSWTPKKSWRAGGRRECELEDENGARPWPGFDVRWNSNASTPHAEGRPSERGTHDRLRGRRRRVVVLLWRDGRCSAMGPPPRTEI